MTEIVLLLTGVWENGKKESRRSGEIGRRTGLKIQRGDKPRGGSTPPSGMSYPWYFLDIVF